jgi:hypothetical protein
MERAALACCDFYIENSSADGIVLWDMGAPLNHKLENFAQEKADPFNDYEPVDSSAAAIAAQGLLRLGRYLKNTGKSGDAKKYTQSGLTLVKTLLDEPYLSTDGNHQGLLLHSVYHYPNGWDYIPFQSKIPFGESSMWGDYHFREAVLYVDRLSRGGQYPVFFNI